MYKILKVTVTDDNHFVHGGYEFYTLYWAAKRWTRHAEVYTYSTLNHNVVDGRDPIDNLMVGIMSVIFLKRETGLSLITVTTDVLPWHFGTPTTFSRPTICQPYNNNAGPVYNNMQGYNYLGATEINGTWFTVFVTELTVMSTDPTSAYYQEGSGM